MWHTSYLVFFKPVLQRFLLGIQLSILTDTILHPPQPIGKFIELPLLK